MTKTMDLKQAQSGFLEYVDVDYACDLALKLGTYRTHENLGYRTAGSFAEHQAADMLKAEMERIGLQDLKTYAFPVDAWTFKRARMVFDTGDRQHVFELGAYPTHFVTEGSQPFTIIDGIKGTAMDLAQKDVKGKFVLIDINQRDEWWINYPTYEAFLNGAAGVIAVQNGGYGEVSDEALNAQNTAVPHGAAALSMAQKDAAVLREAMKASGSDTLEVRLDVSSVIDPEGTSYNIFGCIPGKASVPSSILVTAHYDAYFTGFQDNSAAVGIMMAMAKSLIESGYQPEKTLIFGALGAEEWGKSETRYDWLTGSHMQMSKLTPGWNQTVFANINFELPAMLEGETDWIRSSYELKSFLEGFVSTLPHDGEVFPQGVEVLTPIETWSDDFAFEIAGIPATVTALRPGFSATHYHSQFDNEDTYNEAAYRFHHQMYGLLLLEYDSLKVAPLDFRTRFLAFRNTLNPDVFSVDEHEAKHMYQSLDQLLDKVIAVSKDVWDKVQSFNSASDDDPLVTLQIHQALLDVFKFAEDHFVCLSWEDDVIFPHEQEQHNAEMLQKIISCLRRDPVDLAGLHAAVKCVDNNKYAYAFSRETYDYYTRMVIGENVADMMWGSQRVRNHLDLFALAGIGDKRDYRTEIAFLETKLAETKKALQTGIHQELGYLQQMLAQLSEVDAMLLKHTTCTAQTLKTALKPAARTRQSDPAGIADE